MCPDVPGLASNSTLRGERPSTSCARPLSATRLGVVMTSQPFGSSTRAISSSTRCVSKTCSMTSAATTVAKASDLNGRLASSWPRTGRRPREAAMRSAGWDTSRPTRSASRRTAAGRRPLADRNRLRDGRRGLSAELLAIALRRGAVLVGVLPRDLQVLVAVLHARLDLRRLHPLVEGADDDRPLRIGSQRAVPGRLVVRPVAAIAGAGRRPRGRVVAAGRHRWDPQLVWRDRRGLRGPARQLAGRVARPGDRVRADAVPGVTAQNAELITIGDPHRVVVRVDLAADEIPRRVVELARLPEEDDGAALVADDRGMVDPRRVEGAQLGDDVVNTREVRRLEVNGGPEAAVLGHLEQTREVRIGAVAV